NLFLYIFIYIFHLNPIISKILQAFIVMLWNFPLQKYWVFKNRLYNKES
ncbi:MAG: GtrA family protein, partial [Spirochaetes bacterium]|nr:GtrA family protein [Spirochaetota bacterium]